MSGWWEGAYLSEGKSSFQGQVQGGGEACQSRSVRAKVRAKGSRPIHGQRDAQATPPSALVPLRLLRRDLAQTRSREAGEAQSQNAGQQQATKEGGHWPETLQAVQMASYSNFEAGYSGMNSQRQRT